MINGDRNSWTARKKLSHRSQIAKPFAKWRVSNTSDMQSGKPYDLRETLYSEALEVADHEFNIGFSEFKTADRIWRTLYFGNPTILVELRTPGLLGSLITKLTSDSYFLEWRIQYGGHEIFETLRFSHNSVIRGFRGRWLQISSWIFRIPYSGLNMADIKFRNLSRFIKILCLYVSEVFVHDSDILRSA